MSNLSRKRSRDAQGWDVTSRKSEKFVGRRGGDLSMAFGKCCRKKRRKRKRERKKRRRSSHDSKWYRAKVWTPLSLSLSLSLWLYSPSLTLVPSPSSSRIPSLSLSLPLSLVHPSSSHPRSHCCAVFEVTSSSSSIIAQGENKQLDLGVPDKYILQIKNSIGFGSERTFVWPWEAPRPKVNCQPRIVGYRNETKWNETTRDRDEKKRKREGGGAEEKKGGRERERESEMSKYRVNRRMQGGLADVT